MFCIPTVVLWILWLFSAVFGLVSVLVMMDDLNDDSAKIVFVTVCCILLITVPWYRNGLAEVNSRPYQTNVVGIVENTTLPSGIIVSIVKTDKEIINLSDVFHAVLPAGVTYAKLTQTNDVAYCLWFTIDKENVWYK